jgi:hypothetical protein
MKSSTDAVLVGAGVGMGALMLFVNPLITAGVLAAGCIGAGIHSSAQEKKKKKKKHTKQMHPPLARYPIVIPPPGPPVSNQSLVDGPGSATCQELPPFQNLAQAETQAYADTMNEMQKNTNAVKTPCCPVPPPCEEKVVWQARFKGCGPSWSTSKGVSCQVAPLGDRYWVADLNPLMYQRGILTGEIWNPYQHFNARQMHTQFLTTDFPKNRDPYTRPIQNLDQTYCAQMAKNGPPEYTRF